MHESAYTHVYTHLHTNATHTHTHMHTRTYAIMRTHTHTHTNTHTHTHTHTQDFLPTSDVQKESTVTSSMYSGTLVVPSPGLTKTFLISLHPPGGGALIATGVTGR